MIDWVERGFCILLSLCILANALVVRRIVHSWSFPAVVFALAWFLYTIVPLVFFPSAHVYPVAVFYILCASIAVSVGGFSNWRQAFVLNAQSQHSLGDDFGSKPLLSVFFGAFAISAVCFLVNSVLQGISLDRLITNLNESAGEYAGRRYIEDIESNIFQQVGTVLAYFSCGIGGLIILDQRSRLMKGLVVLTSLLPSVFVMLSQSAKGMLFLSAAIFFGGIVVAKVRRADLTLITKKALPVVVLGALLSALLVSASFFARGVSGEGLMVAWASYTSGHLFAFSDWLGSELGMAAAQAYRDPELSGGFYTFMSVFKAFGDDRYVPLGIYTEYLAIPPYIETNIYTVFRGMVRDFGILGSLVALWLLSFFSHRAYKAILMSDSPSYAISIVLITFSFIYQSYIASTLTWASLPAGIFLVGFTLHMRQILRDQEVAREYAV